MRWTGDLAGTTDYRSVLSALLVARAGLSPAALPTVFPDAPPPLAGLARPR